MFSGQVETHVCLQRGLLAQLLVRGQKKKGLRRDGSCVGRPIDQLSVDCRPTVDQQSTVGRQSVDASTDIFSPTVDRQSVVRLTVGRQSVHNRWTVGRRSTDRKLKYTWAVLTTANKIWRPSLKCDPSPRPIPPWRGGMGRGDGSQILTTRTRLCWNTPTSVFVRDYTPTIGESTSHSDSDICVMRCFAMSQQSIYPFIPKGDQCQISPAASPEYLHTQIVFTLKSITQYEELGFS